MSDPIIRAHDMVDASFAAWKNEDMVTTCNEYKVYNEYLMSEFLIIDQSFLHMYARLYVDDPTWRSGNKSFFWLPNRTVTHPRPVFRFDGWPVSRRPSWFRDFAVREFPTFPDALDGKLGKQIHFRRKWYG